MDLHEAINHPKVNVFDIVQYNSGKFDVHTYRKPGESKEAFQERYYKNLNKAMQLKKKL